MKVIEIDFEIHQAIEAERRNFDEPEYEALKRLLKIDSPNTVDSRDSHGLSKKPFVEDGVSIEHGSSARMSYQRGTQHFQGKFLDGMLVVDGKTYSTLSGAACDLARTREGNKTSLNGWIYWEVKAPNSSTWRRMSDVRADVHHRLKQTQKHI